jgi:hypothetical protein
MVLPTVLPMSNLPHAANAAAGDDNFDGLVPFDTIVRKGVLVKEIDERRQALIGQCRSNNGLTLQEVIDHNDWLLQIERDLSKARARIEREFRISNALSLKVREGKRKAQLQQRLDVLRSQCDVLNECIHGLSDHCAWFQESGTYREAVEYLEGRWDDVDDHANTVDEARFELRGTGDRAGLAGGEDSLHLAGLGGRHELDGLIHGDAPVGGRGGDLHADAKKGAVSASTRRKKKKRGNKAGAPGVGDGDAAGPPGASDDDDEEENGGRESDLDFFAPDYRWLRGAGRSSGGYVDVWAPD